MEKKEIDCKQQIDILLIDFYILVSTGPSATARASSRRAESQQHLDRVSTPSVNGRLAIGDKS
jgi:hypothetical protein